MLPALGVERFSPRQNRDDLRFGVLLGAFDRRRRRLMFKLRVDRLRCRPDDRRLASRGLSQRRAELGDFRRAGSSADRSCAKARGDREDQRD